VLTALFVAAAPVLAAEVADVAEALAADGFYVEQGASISEQQAGDLVATMNDAGEGFSLVVLSNEPAAGAATFADNVQFALGRGIVLVIAPESVGYAGEGDFFNEVELERAFDAAADVSGSDFDLAATFVEEVTGVSVGAPAGARAGADDCGDHGFGDVERRQRPLVVPPHRRWHWSVAVVDVASRQGQEASRR
jgi:hypothetical protein